MSFRARCARLSRICSQPMPVYFLWISLFHVLHIGNDRSAYCTVSATISQSA